ncbi:MAG: efflux transporter outer membrane subunit [Ralstonia sp.]|nr:efflux transporter outer membrane subunit [Ralstonia sp.]
MLSAIPARHLPSLVVATACLLLAGCAVSPAYEVPVAAAPQTFKEAAGWLAAAPADTLDRGPWWTLFGDAQLNQLADSIDISNQNVAQALAAYEQARALVREQRASLFPSVKLTGSGARSGGGGEQQANNNYKGAIGASWEPDIWGRLRAGVTGADASASASAADLAAARLSAQGELATNYFSLRQSDAQIALLNATIAGYKRVLDITSNRFNAGIAAKSDLLQAQTQLANAQIDLSSQTRARAQLEHAIAILLGRAPSDFSLAVAPWTLSVPEVPLGVPSTLLQRRPDIAAAERRMAAVNAQIGVAKAAYFPTLTLGASAGLAANTLTRLATLPSRVWSIGPTLAATLFDGGARAAAVDKAGAAYDASVATYRQTVLGAFQDVEDNLAALRWQTQEFGVQADAVKAAQEAAQLNLNRYRAGTVSFLEVITAQATAYSAERTLLTLQGKQYSAAVLLVKALGGGWHGEVPVVGKAALQPASTPAAQ